MYRDQLPNVTIGNSKHDIFKSLICIYIRTYTCCLHVMKSKQISKIVGLSTFQSLNGVIKYANFECDIFQSPFKKARSTEYERTKVAKWPL